MLRAGEIQGYTEMLIETRQIAAKRMVDEAEAMGADAIVNTRFGSSAAMQRAAEIIIKERLLHNKTITGTKKRF